MGGSSKAPATTTTTAEPPAYIQPFLQNAASEAQKLYQGGAPSYYPGQAFVSPSAATTQGLGQIEQQAMQGGQLTPAATQELLGTIQGRGVNPFLGQAVQSATAPLYDQFKNETIPQLQSIFARTGGTGGSAEGFGAERAATALGRGFAEQAGTLAYQSAAQERQNQLNAITQAPALDAARFADAQKLLGVGGAREAQSAAELQAEMDKYNYNQNAPALALNQYIAQLTGTAPSGTGIRTTGSTPATSSDLTSALFGGIGGGALGAGAAGALGLSAGLVAAPAVGLGALYGLGSNRGWF